MRSGSPPNTYRVALERLLDIAQGDTGQSRIVANFLLAWWNAEECGGFDLTDMWGVDTSIAVDILRVFALVAGRQRYPDDMGYRNQFEAIISTWRPALVHCR
ncbi:MAG TPA: hypothetical protein VLI55_20505 [Bryobacteraceae bacterium]|nr:hypothetical protein [Bryobacteraceae bacterium]